MSWRACLAIWTNKKSASPYFDNLDKLLLKYYKERHTSKDYRLLKGVYTNEKLKNKQLECLESCKDDFDEKENNENFRRKILEESGENVSIGYTEAVFKKL